MLFEFIWIWHLKVSPNKPCISWYHYKTVHELDVLQNPTVPTRVYPKITERHLDLDNFSKMSVKYACQVKNWFNTYYRFIICDKENETN